MRKLTGAVVIGLLALMAPAVAQAQFQDRGGMADPLGLVASGAVIPYVGGGLGGAVASIQQVNPVNGSLFGGLHTGSISILEIASPVGSNAPPQENPFGSKPLHMFFFDQSCLRVGPSIGLPLTVNDSEFFNLNSIANIPAAGLIAAAAVDNSGGQSGVLDPLSNAIHARVLWINVLDGTLSRVLEPISIHNPEADVPIGGGATARFVWNPLRTGATVVAPFEGSGVRTTLYLVCPTRLVIPGVFPESRGFPHLDPVPVPSTSATPLFLRIYDDEEEFRRNVHIFCRCWGATPLAAIDPVYTNANPQTGTPNGTYTEIEGEPACNTGESECSFTGYKSIQWGAGVVGNDLFGRLSNGNFLSLQGIPPIVVGPGFNVPQR